MREEYTTRAWCCDYCGNTITERVNKNTPELPTGWWRLTQLQSTLLPQETHYCDVKCFIKASSNVRTNTEGF